MVTSKRLEEKREILNKFLVNNPQYKEIADVFGNFLHKENKHRCEIHIGKNNGDYFQSYLSIVVKSYNVILSNYETEPEYIIREYDNGNTLAVFNLALMENVHIDIAKDDYDNILDYEITFTYSQREYKIDYHMSIAMRL